MTTAPPIPTHETAPRTYQRMLSGRLLHLLDPSPLDIELSDLVMGISRQMRWNGQTRGELGFTVAQHSVIVDDILLGMVWAKAPREARLWALVHDLAEAILSDLNTPVKACIGPSGYHELERRLETAVRLRLGLPGVLPSKWSAAVKKADRISAFTEAVRLACWSVEDARREVAKGYRGPMWHGPLDPWPEQVARKNWMERYREICAAE